MGWSHMRIFQKKRLFHRRNGFMPRSPFKTLALTIGACVLTYSVAMAAMAVVDSGANAELSSIDTVVKISRDHLKNIDETTDALLESFGKKSKVSLGNMASLQRQNRLWSGVIKDPKSLQNSLQLPKEIKLPEFTAMLGIDEFWKQALTYSPLDKPLKKAGKIIPQVMRQADSEVLRYRRFKTSEDSNVKGLAVADTAVTDFSRVISELANLQAEADAADTDVKRQSVIMNLLIKANQQQATTNLLLAVQLNGESANKLNQMPLYLHSGRYNQPAEPE